MFQVTAPTNACNINVYFRMLSTVFPQYMFNNDWLTFVSSIKIERYWHRITFHQENIKMVNCIELSWDYYTETGHSPATSIIEISDASRAIVLPFKLYRHSKSSGASSLLWLGRSRGKHGNCRGHSAVKWSARWEPTSQTPLISEHAPFYLYGETH